MASYTIPLGKITPEDLAALEEKVKSDLRERAARVLKTTPDKIVIRALEPSDLNLTTPEWKFTINTAGDWNDVVNIDLLKNKVIALVGIAYPYGQTPNTVAIEMISGKETRGHVHYQSWEADQEKKHYFNNVVVWEEENVKIRLLAKSGLTTPLDEPLILLGFVAEKYDVTISAPGK